MNATVHTHLSSCHLQGLLFTVGLDDHTAHQLAASLRIHYKPTAIPRNYEFLDAFIRRGWFFNITSGSVKLAPNFWKCAGSSVFLLHGAPCWAEDARRLQVSL